MSDFEIATLVGLRDGPWGIAEAEKQAITWALARIAELEAALRVQPDVITILKLNGVAQGDQHD